MTGLRRLVTRAIAADLAAFVVPDVQVAHAVGLDLTAAGLRVVANPRHASVLLIVHELPSGLAKAAATVYAQMPRPRGIVVVGVAGPDWLPDDAIVTAPGQTGLADGVRRLRDALAIGAWSADTTPFPPHAPMAHATDEPAGEHDDGSSSSGAQHEMNAEADRRHSSKEDDTGQPNPDRNSDHHGSMDHGGMNHGEFMSMVAMTEGTPRSRDGLQMEWVETPFGPLFPGLPAGLNLTLTLDGDTVARAEATSAMAGQSLGAYLPCPVADFPDLLAELDPLAPVDYRLLALRALEAATGTASLSDGAARIGALERERLASHLGWLARFGELIGVSWLADRAGSLNLAVVRAESNTSVIALTDPIERFTRRAESLPLLDRRLRGIGHLDPAAATAALGPVARGSGLRRDARTDDPRYIAAGFRPVVRPGGDARSRLTVRLAEIRQSLALIATTGAMSPAATPAARLDSGSGAGSDSGSATVETPRGAATLAIMVVDGYVEKARLHPPSTAHLALVPAVAEGVELADALVGIASLDLSPWAVRT